MYLLTSPVICGMVLLRSHMSGNSFVLFDFQKHLFISFVHDPQTTSNHHHTVQLALDLPRCGLLVFKCILRHTLGSVPKGVVDMPTLMIHGPIL